jgi:hypothetical protein
VTPFYLPLTIMCLLSIVSVGEKMFELRCHVLSYKSKKMGRPPVDNPLSERIYLRVDKEISYILDKCCKELEKTRSQIVREGILLVEKQLLERSEPT